MQKRCVSALQRLEVLGLVIESPVLPTAEEDAYPLEGESAQCALVRSAASALLRVEGSGPEGARNGLSRPFDEGLTQEGWARETPVHPMAIAAALGDGRDACVALQVLGVAVAVSVFAERAQQARRECLCSTRKRCEDSIVGESGAELGDASVVLSDRREQWPKLGDESLHAQRRWQNDAGVGGERDGGFDRLDALLDASGGAYIVLNKEGAQRVAARGRG